jgi:hypothetical protein
MCYHTQVLSLNFLIEDTGLVSESSFHSMVKFSAIQFKPESVYQAPSVE